MATPHSALVIVGSLRKQSFTLKIANALAPSDVCALN